MAKAKNKEPEADVGVSISQDNAVLLLAAAEELGLDASVVRVVDDQLVAPASVVEKAGAEPTPEEPAPEGEGE